MLPNDINHRSKKRLTEKKNKQTAKATGKSETLQHEMLQLEWRTDECELMLLITGGTTTTVLLFICHAWFCSFLDEPREARRISEKMNVSSTECHIQPSLKMLLLLVAIQLTAAAAFSEIVRTRAPREAQRKK